MIDSDDELETWTETDEGHRHERSAGVAKMNSLGVEEAVGLVELVSLWESEYDWNDDEENDGENDAAPAALENVNVEMLVTADFVLYHGETSK